MSALRATVILLTTTLVSATLYLVAVEGRRAYRLHVCETCLESDAPGICAPLCGLCPRDDVNK